MERKIYPSPVVSVAILLDDLRPLVDDATWQRLGSLLTEGSEEETEQLLASCLPVLKGCRLYYPEDEAVFFSGMMGDIYVLVNPANVYEMRLRPEAVPLKEAGARLDLQDMFPWFWPLEEAKETT